MVVSEVFPAYAGLILTMNTILEKLPVVFPAYAGLILSSSDQ